MQDLDNFMSEDSELTGPSVHIVLLNWNGWRDTLECIRSLEQMEYKNWRAIIVDNGSTDDSVEQLRRSYPKIPIIETGRNLGFAAGNNVGIRYALERGADYVFVLNNDTTVFEDVLSQLVQFAERHPDAALMSPKINRRDEYREWPVRRSLDLLTVLCAFSPLRRFIVRVPILSKAFYYTGKEPARVCFLPGSALFFRATTFQIIGLFDENTFLDFEELIIAEKLRAARLCAYFVPQAEIRHKGSASGSKLRARRYIENARSENYFFSEYVSLSPASRWLIRLVRFANYSARALRYKGYRDHFGEFTSVLLSSGSARVK